MRRAFHFVGFGVLAVAFALPSLGADDPMYKIRQVGAATVQVARFDNRVITVRVGNQMRDYYPTEDAKVYLAKPPNMFDDKGNIKRPNAAELAKLKGKNPGYPGDFDAVRPQSVVSLNLVQKVLAKPLPKGEKDPEAGKVYYSYILVP